MKKINIKLSEIYFFCECEENCHERATQHHHIFPDTKVNRRLYGKRLDHDLNIKLANHNHHANMPNMSELEFCEMLGMEPKSKVLSRSQRE